MILMTVARIVPMTGYFRLRLYRWGGVDIEKGTGRCGVVKFDTMHPENIHIGKGCEIVDGCTILTHFYDTNCINSHKHIRGEVFIGRNVYMGTNVIIAKPVSIGDGAVIGAGSVVNRNIPSNEVWAGVPARFIKKRPCE